MKPEVKLFSYTWSNFFLGEIKHDVIGAKTICFAENK
jgi:hypothetical protein